MSCPAFYTRRPRSGIVPKFSSPPQIPKAYADFIDVMITRFGESLRMDRAVEPAERSE